MSDNNPKGIDRDELEYLAGRAGLSDNPAVRDTIDAAIATSDAELAASIREFLLIQAAAVGIPDNPFLPGPGELPPGEIVLGSMLDGGQHSCQLPLGELPRHILCVGGAGSGKSSWIKTLMIQLNAWDVRYWILDVQNEHHDLAAVFGPEQLIVLDVSDFRRNPLEILPGEQPLDVVTRMKDVSYEQYLRDGSLNLLDQVLKELFEEYAAGEGNSDGPTFADYYAKLSKMSFRATARHAGYLESLVNRAQGLLNHLGDTTYNCVRGFDLHELMRTSMILRLDGLDIDTLKFFVNDLLSAVGAIRASDPAASREPLVVVIEESHMCVPPRQYSGSGNREPFICSQLRLLRKRGVGLVLADQTPAQLPDTVIGNTATKVIMQLVNGHCKESISRAIGLTSEQRDYLSELPKRTAVVHYPGYPQAFLIGIPELSMPDPPSEAELRRMMEPRLRELQCAVRYRETSRLEANPPKASQKGFAVQGQPPLSKDAVDYLQDIAERPFVPSTRRDADLNLSSWKGNDLREQLLARKLVTKQSVNTARRGGVVTLLEITDAGETFLAEIGVKVHKPAGKGGFEHRFWQNEVVKYLSREYQRCEPVIEDFRFGKAVDVGVKLDGRWVAVEIGVTGLDKELENIRADLSAGYDEVWLCLSKKDRDGLRQAAERELDRDTLDRVQWKLLSEFLPSAPCLGALRLE